MITALLNFLHLFWFSIGQKLWTVSGTFLEANMFPKGDVNIQQTTDWSQKSVTTKFCAVSYDVQLKREATIYSGK